MADDLTPGTVLRGKYRVDRFLGAGGMGRVLEGFHLDLERRVAIKILHPDLRQHADLVTRFIREGRAAAKIEGEHVAKVLDVDKLEDGTPFLVMEFLEGSDLSSVRKSGKPIAVRDAVEYVLQACEAIRDAHAHGIIHRDLKPANLFLTKKRDGTAIVKVLDFGISKLSNAPGGSEPSMTRTSIVMGSAEYMSPEQMLSTRDVDVRTDIWALGAVLFELMTARPPFAGETMTQVCAMVMSQPVPSPRALRSEVTPELEQIILTCLNKEREQRFANIGALARALTTSLLTLEGPTTAPLPDLKRSDPPHGSVGLSASGAPSQASQTSATPFSAIAQPTPRMGPPDGLPTKVIDENERRSMPGGSTPPQASAGVLPNRTTISSPGYPSSGGLDTNIPVSSEPLSPPPMRSSAGAVIVAIAVLVAGGLGLGAFMLVRGAASHSAASPSAPSASFVSPPNTSIGTADDHPRPSGGITVEPAPLTTGTATSSAVAAAPSASAPKSTSKSNAPTKTGGTPPIASSKATTPKPVKTSGID